MISQAMILAAGRGERMRPLTDRVPKPLLEVGGMTMLDRQLFHLRQHCIRRIVVNAAYKAEMIEAHLLALNDPAITLSREEEALETGGGVRRALHFFGGDPFFVLNSDVILLNGERPFLAHMEEAWKEQNCDALLLLVEEENTTGYHGSGDFFRDAGGSIRRKREGEERAPYVYTGVQILHPRFMEGAPEGAFSFNLLYDRHRKAEGWLGNIGSLIHDGRWLHVGDVRAISEAEDILRI